MRAMPTMSVHINQADLNKDLVEWYKERNERLEGLLHDFIREYCDREGPEDMPIDCENQSCASVREAMRFLDV